VGSLGHDRESSRAPEAARWARGVARPGSIGGVDALILASGDVSTRAAIDAAWPGWAADVGLVIAADGGARHAAALGLRIDRWVGDGDSITPEALRALEAAGVPLDRVPAGKDESDTELAIRMAVGLGAGRVILVGALGGDRIDHTLANIGLLWSPDLAGRSAAILDGRVRIRGIRAPDADGRSVWLDLPGRLGDLVSLLPAGDVAEGVTTVGLAYPLLDEPLPAGPARGLSNVRAATDAAVALRLGRLLVVESPATL